MSKWVNVSEVNNTLGKALEACKDELTPSFYSGAKCVLDKINEIAEQTEPQTHTVDLGNGFSITANDCDTCKHRDKPFDDLPCDMCCKAHSGYEPRTEYDKGLKLFADILFDKDKSNQFLEECKAMGIEPQTDIGTSDTVYSDTAGYVPRVDMTDCSWK